MSKLILIKHSLPEIDSARPAHEWRLSEVGRHRCRALAQALAEDAPQTMVCSDEPKAVETAQLVAGTLNLRFETRPNLHEHERRTAPFLAKDEFSRTVQRFFVERDALVFGEETANQALHRFDGAVLAALAASAQQPLAVVAHGTVISLFVARYAGIDGFALWQKLGLPSFITLSWPEATIVRVVEDVA